MEPEQEELPDRTPAGLDAVQYIADLKQEPHNAYLAERTATTEQLKWAPGYGDPPHLRDPRSSASGRAQLGYAPLPVGPLARSVCCDGHLIAINVSSKIKDAAFEVISTLSRKRFRKEIRDLRTLRQDRMQAMIRCSSS